MQTRIMLRKELMSRVVQLWRRCKFKAYARTEGSQIAEFAISLPLLAVIVIGITDFGSAFNLKYKLSNAVREGLRFASTQTASDLTNPTPLTIAAVHDVVDNYLVGARVNDCGLSTASPTNSGLVWTYTANTGCPGNGTLTLTIDHGNTFQTTGANPVAVETTHIRISYPYQWRFSSVIRVLIPTAQYAGVTQITTEAVMQNLN